MSTPTRLAAFVGVLAAVFALAFGVGRVVDPDVEVDEHDDTASHAADGDADGRGHGPGKAHDTGEQAEEARHAGARPTLALDRTEVGPGRRQVTFRVLDEHGSPVTAYTTRHEKDLHLVVVREDDLRDYQHVHPTLAADGRWTAELSLAEGGSYRLYADTQPRGGDPVVLEASLAVRGAYQGRVPLATPVATASVDGYDVTLSETDAGLTFSVARDGEPVTDLQPYLGAYGHLVAIRADDLEYLHVHPEDGPAGPDVAFAVEWEVAGRHALYLDFRHGGTVRTARFTYDATAGEGGHSGH